MDVARPHAVLCPTLDSEVLVVLASTTRPLTGRDVARLVRKGSRAGVHRTLRRLVEHGVVLATEAGPAFLYVLNRDHLAAPAVEILASLRQQLVIRLRGAIDAWDVKPAHASLFGSAARGDGDTSSDIDLFFVRPGKIGEDDPSWRSRLDRLVGDVERWTGNRATVAEVSEAEVRSLRTRQPAIVADLRRDSVTLAGPSASEVLRVGK